jgi:hypothetical protein
MNVKVYYFTLGKEVSKQYTVSSSATVADLKRAIINDQDSPLHGQAPARFEITTEPSKKPVPALSGDQRLNADEEYHAWMQ